MRQEMYINLLGHCEKCDHIMTRNAKVTLDKDILTPCKCPECHEGTVYFEKLAVHHRPGAAQPQRIMCPGKDTFKHAKEVFHWGMLATGFFIMISYGALLHCGSALGPTWNCILAGAAVLLFAVLWTILNRAFERAASLDWETPHGRLSGE